jgi:hypothetical protein
MTTSTRSPLSAEEVDELRATIYARGVVGLQQAFDPEWADELNADVLRAFDEARSRPNGAIGRGPNRYYVEIHPEQIRGFVELATHPWIDAVCAAVLGPDYRIVEVGFDVPGPGAMNQPWHRDFPMPAVTRDEGRLDSLAVNVTTVDTEPDMGPFEIAPGTQFDLGDDFDHGMFPPRERYSRYEELAERKFPQRGDVSIRSALTIHRGTLHRSSKQRPVLVLGVDAPGGINAERHDMAVTKGFWASLPESLRRHLDCPIVDELKPIEQKHTIEGLVMGVE